MAEFRTLEQAIHRAVTLAATSGVVLFAVTAASLAFAVRTAGNAQELARHMPVFVVPGAIGGVYTPGITEEQMRATARYLATLATNFGGPRNFAERFDELETFAAPRFLPALRMARRGLQRDVDTQNQSRTFFAIPGTESFRRIGSGRYEYAVDGDRTVYASGLPMNRNRCRIRLRLRWGSPSERNRAGIVLEGFNVVDEETK